MAKRVQASSAGVPVVIAAAGEHVVEQYRAYLDARRPCLPGARVEMGCPVITADRRWKEAEIGVEVISIR